MKQQTQQPVFKEEKITSPIDESTNCYRVYTEPETEDYFLCLSTGFMTTSYYKKDSNQLKNVMNQNPKLVQQLQWEDKKTNLVWFPVFLNMGDLGMIYPEGNEHQWFWKYAKVVDIPEEKRNDYPVPGKSGEFYETKLDVENATTYIHTDFLGACFDMGIIKDEDGDVINHLFNRG
tara:strand:- start:250 stop:777 length:528 start_codon:yes stop_codon:yes gene_type:complete